MYSCSNCSSEGPTVSYSTPSGYGTAKPILSYRQGSSASTIRKPCQGTCRTALGCTCG